jgi:LPXTG-motif cell wall-anchored protein
MKALAIILIAIGFLILAGAGLRRVGSLFWSSDSGVEGVAIEPTMPVWVLGLIGLVLVGVGAFLLWRRQR